MKFLKKYRFKIILLCVLAALMFWLIPAQEKHYFKPDLDRIKYISLIVVLIIILTIILSAVLFFSEKVKSIWQAVMVFIKGLLFSIPLFFILKPAVLFCLLVLNRIETGTTVRQYSFGFYLGGNKTKPVFLDNKEEAFYIDHIGNLHETYDMKYGDPASIHLRKGLLGFPFDPSLTTTSIKK